MSTPEIEPWMERAAMEFSDNCFPVSEELTQQLAAIIARHAKSESANEKLLAAAKDILQWSHLDDAREWRSDLAKLESAITAAESAPASLERELVEALLPIVEAEETYRAGKMPKGDRIGRLTKARAVLRKYDEAKK